MYGLKIENGSKAIYNIGDTVSLMLQVDEIDAVTIGDTILVEIKDFAGNKIDEVTASRLNDVYYCEWKIPFSVHRDYNPGAVAEVNTSVYELSDSWVLPDAPLAFPFWVEKKAEEAVVNNCLYEVEIQGVLSVDLEGLNPYSFKFSSNLDPYYCSIDDVRSVYQEELSLVDDVDIARDIVLTSKQVLLHMMPEKIWRQDQLDLAIKMYCKYYVARQHLSFYLNINAETKELDMLKYSRNSNDPVRIIEGLDALIQKYAYIIWAGGKDTPFIPKTFTKGVFDPNRTNANRLGLDTSDPYPWVNTSTSNSVYTDSRGQTVELRGTRTVTFLRNRTSSPNVWLRSEGLS